MILSSFFFYYLRWYVSTNAALPWNHANDKTSVQVIVCGNHAKTHPPIQQWLRSLAKSPPVTLIITWWHHDMETFSALLATCAGNSPVPVISPHKGQWRGALMFPLICAPPSSRHAHEFLMYVPSFTVDMMTSSNGNIFRVTGPLFGEFTGPRWIPHTKASDAKFWCFLWSASE